MKPKTFLLSKCLTFYFARLTNLLIHFCQTLLFSSTKLITLKKLFWWQRTRGTWMEDMSVMLGRYAQTLTTLGWLLNSKPLVSKWVSNKFILLSDESNFYEWEQWIIINTEIINTLLRCSIASITREWQNRSSNPKRGSERGI